MDAPLDIPGAEYVGPAPSASAPPQIPGAEYVGPASTPAPAPTPPAAQPAIPTTPEMAARQQMMEENAQRGTATSFGASILGNFQGIAAGIQNAAAPLVQPFSPDAAENLRIAAARSLAYAGSPDHPIANVAGGIVGGLPGAFAGPAGAALSAANAGEEGGVIRRSPGVEQPVYRCVRRG